MFEGFSKREIVGFVVALIVVCVLSGWGGIFVVKKYIIGDRDDPLARAGGLKPLQELQVK